MQQLLNKRIEKTSDKTRQERNTMKMVTERIYQGWVLTLSKSRREYSRFEYV